MQFFFNLTLALRAIRTNRLRSVLTILIIGFGIMALVGILTASDVLESSVSSSFGSMGANTFQITGEVLKKSRRRSGASMASAAGKKIKYDEAVAFQRRYMIPSQVGISMTGTVVATVKAGSEKTNPNVRVVGVDDKYIPISDSKLSSGRNFSTNDLQSGGYTCIIGADILTKLFKGKAANAINKTLSVGDVKYTVIGVLDSKGGSMMMNSDNIILVPIANARSVYGGDQPYVISVAVPKVNQKAFAAEEAEGLFRMIRKVPVGADSDFTINQNDSLVEQLMTLVRFISWAAVLIAIITVLGSVVGLMNIMLVSVAERTREIGISKALGAKAGTIRMQFLTESIIISLLGGFSGVIAGILAGNGIGLLLHGSFVMPWLWISIAIGLCCFVGVLSGIYPAIKASRLDPIVALRYE